MFKVKNKQYEFKFTTDRVALVEATVKHGIMSELYGSNGMFSLQTVAACFQFAGKEAGKEEYLSQEDGAALMDEALKACGYATIVLEIQEALKADLPFLFR